MSERRFMTDGPSSTALRTWGFIGICVWAVIGAGVILTGAGRVLGALVDPLAAFLIAGVICILVRPSVRWMRKHRMGRALSAAIGTLWFLAAVILLVIFFAAPIVNGASQLIANAPETAQKLTTEVNHLVDKFNALPPSFKNNIQNAVGSLASDVAAFGQAAVKFFVGSIGSVFSVGLSVFMGLILTFWFLLDGEKISSAMKSVVPSRWRDDAVEITRVFDRSFTGYLIGSAINVSVVFLGCGIGFAVIHLPGAWFLAAVIGILDLIPFVGPLIGGAIAVLVALTVSPTTAVLTLLIVLVVEQFVDSFLSPIVMGKVVTLHPVAVIFALVVGIAIAGFFGAILAIPVAAAIHTIYDYYKAKFSPAPPDEAAADVSTQEA